jgi:septal ring factor EnvC (AmiA/AmiB activator)
MSDFLRVEHTHKYPDDGNMRENSARFAALEESLLTVADKCGRVAGDLAGRLTRKATIGVFKVLHKQIADERQRTAKLERLADSQATDLHSLSDDLVRTRQDVQRLNDAVVKHAGLIEALTVRAGQAEHVMHLHGRLIEDEPDLTLVHTRLSALYKMWQSVDKCEQPELADKIVDAIKMGCTPEEAAAWLNRAKEL